MDFLLLTPTETSSSAIISVHMIETANASNPAYLETEIARVLPNPVGEQKRKTEES